MRWHVIRFCSFSKLLFGLLRAVTGGCPFTVYFVWWESCAHAQINFGHGQKCCASFVVPWVNVVLGFRCRCFIVSASASMSPWIACPLSLAVVIIWVPTKSFFELASKEPSNCSYIIPKSSPETSQGLMTGHPASPTTTSLCRVFGF